MSRRVLVTGGAGFIGSHLADAYLERGWEVAVLDDLSMGLLENVDSRVEFVEAKLGDPAALDLVRNGRFDVISHHAAQMDVRVSVADPATDAETNVIGGLRLAQAAVDAGVRKFIFASSGGTVYGDPVRAPQDEAHPANPISPYGCAKLSFEHYLGYYSAVFGLAAVSLRYGNVYGPRQRRDGEAGVIAILAGKLLAGEPVVINGTGAQTRDYVYIDDVVRANMAVSEGDLQGVFNVGTGIETSVFALWEAIQEAAGIRGTATRAPAKKGEQMRVVLDGTKLRNAASLPEPMALAEGLRVTVEWLRGRSS